MICPTCSTDSAHIRVETNGKTGCHNCLGFSESGGSPTDKVLTRASSRITEQQIQHEGDMQTPHIVDKSTNRVVVNEEFINLYPEQAAQTYTQEELKSVGQQDLKPAVDTDDGKGIEFSGNEDEAIEEIIND